MFWKKVAEQVRKPHLPLLPPWLLLQLSPPDFCPEFQPWMINSKLYEKISPFLPDLLLVTAPETLAKTPALPLYWPMALTGLLILYSLNSL